ncbi:TfoX/Sxy family protein [Amycolatopsis sp. SID8362]|uniref:TfoX/Sxy family protein n=1 Tax=Amycolatopsis sp. SID8362 TaxID=2690346 RepID=UPI0013D033BC|nr:TfoX/Sxy family protein [Amycolatopsis sp. SID8362]NED40842.1 TfoX/Sxy family protein [Amycolatopsis sp. SID8362]
MSPEGRFEDLVDEFTGRPGITPPGATGGFGRTALRANGRIFAMFVRGQLVLKLPKARVDELVEGGHGVRFDANKGTPMKEWLALDTASPQPWSALAEEALEFVGRK